MPKLDLLCTHLFCRFSSLSAYLSFNRIYVLFLQGPIHEQNHKSTHSSIPWPNVSTIASYEFKQNQMHSKGQFQGPSFCKLVVSYVSYMSMPV